MELPGVIVAILCALAIVGLAPSALRAERRRAHHGRLASVSLAAATLALGASLIALALGAARSDTGRFLMGLGVGVSVGWALSCVVLLARDQR